MWVLSYSSTPACLYKHIFNTIRRSTTFRVTSTASGSTVLVQLYPTWATKSVGFVRTFACVSLTSPQVFRNQSTAAMAVATVMNSTDKVEALVPEMQRAMSAISRFEPEILGECADPEKYLSPYIDIHITRIAQGRPGHWANYQNLDYQAYSMWSITHHVQDLSSGKQTPVSNAYLDHYNAIEAVRAQYYRDGYGKQPRPWG